MSSKGYMRDYMKRRYDERRALAISTLGGKCAECGTTENLEVDHKDRTKKSMTFDRMTMVSIDKFIEELAKCQLLCDPCHNGKTLGERGLQRAIGTHGTLSSCRYCKCDLCREAKNEYNRKRKQRLKDASVAKLA